MNPFDGRIQTGDLSDFLEKARSGTLDDASVGTALEERLMNARTASHAVNNIYHHPDDAQFVPAGFQEK